MQIDTIMILETAKAGEKVKGLSEYRDRRICSYLLDESVHLSHAGYYRMKKSRYRFFLPCHKVSYNGQIKLIYCTEKKVTLCEAEKNLSQKQKNKMIQQLADIIQQLKEKSYLQFGQLEIEEEKIYLDPAEDQIYIIYLPVYQENQAVSIQILEEEIQKKLEMLYEKYQKDTGTFVLQRLDSVYQEEWILKEKSFLIGKQKEEVQCLIQDSKALSRKHCKLFWNAGQWWIMDLGSRNGTFLNKTKLIPNQWYGIKPGDRILAADCEFCMLYGCFKEKEGQAAGNCSCLKERNDERRTNCICRS